MSCCFNAAGATTLLSSGGGRSRVGHLSIDGAEVRPGPRLPPRGFAPLDGLLPRHQESMPIEQRPEARKRGPQGPCSDEELVGHIRRILTDSPFHGEGYRKVW